ncbi:gas vesicle protein [Streptomyces sp. DG2A-72]|uniref:gas vesicle protein n=1 Tax=Streptomyces sp. DG2A-72 TaxID=3051386 RepID=UPI00265C6828|nr:gas vesicle protein [Streptomyces sp. DG2A-72]MDO0937516.1 gas vesicle protein [Streptomyces sp. DG2A-72]
MTQPVAAAFTGPPRPPSPYDPGPGGQTANLADILERVLDKGVVIAGDIRINLLDIELLTIKLRLLVVSVDKAKEMGIDWWEHDPSLSSGANRAGRPGRSLAGETSPPPADDPARALAEENERLRAEIAELRVDSAADRRLQP